MPLRLSSDEQLDAMIDHLQASLAARASGQARVIEGTAEAVEATTLPILEPP